MTATSTLPRPCLLRLPAVLAKTGHGRTSLYAAVTTGSFPAPVKIGPRAAAWLETEVEGWIEKRVAERDNATTQPGTPCAPAGV